MKNRWQFCNAEVRGADSRPEDDDSDDGEKNEAE